MTTYKPNAGRLAARFLKAMAAGRGLLGAAEGYTEVVRGWGQDQITVKAAVSALQAGAFGTEQMPVGLDAMDAIRPRSIIGRLPALRRVPFDVRLVQTVTGTTASFVNESLPKPITSITLRDAGLLRARKVAAISVVTEESAAAGAADDLVSRDLFAATGLALDQAFIDPANSGDEATPASVTYGAPTVAASGDAIADLKALIAIYQGRLDTAAWIMSPETAVALALRGAPFDRLGALGGTLLGLPVVTSRAISQDSSGNYLALLDQDAVEHAESEGVNLSVSTQATVQLQTNPVAGASELVSLWQTNSVGLLAELLAAWRTRGAAETAAVLTGVSY